MAEALEAIMLICFGLSWPMNAYKNFKARTAAGTSWQFILLITLGYFAGIAAKFVSGTIGYYTVSDGTNPLYLVEVDANSANYRLTVDGKQVNGSEHLSSHLHIKAEKKFLCRLCPILQIIKDHFIVLHLRSTFS